MREQWSRSFILHRDLTSSLWDSCVRTLLTLLVGKQHKGSSGKKESSERHPVETTYCHFPRINFTLIMRTCHLPTPNCVHWKVGTSGTATGNLTEGGREFRLACANHASSFSHFWLTMLSWHAVADMTGKVFCLPQHAITGHPLPVPMQLKQAVPLPWGKWLESDLSDLMSVLWVFFCWTSPSTQLLLTCFPG